MGRARLALLAVLGLVQPPCGPPLAPYSAGSISGRVRVEFQLADPNGTPVGIAINPFADGVVVYLTSALRRDSTRTKGGTFRFDQVPIGEWVVAPAVGGVVTDNMYVAIRTKTDRIDLHDELRLKRAGDLVASPNPFPGFLRIQFFLPATLPARLQVEDLTGSLRHVVLDQTLVAGGHQVIWDGKNAAGKPLPDGPYAIVLLAGSERGAEMVIKGDGAPKSETAWRLK